MLTGTAVPYTHVNAGSEGKLTDGLVREMKPKAKSGCGVRNPSLENSAACYGVEVEPDGKCWSCSRLQTMSSLGAITACY